MRRCRRGFSLMEVLMATGILVGCLVVLSELAGIGRRHADDAQAFTAAQVIAQRKLNEVLAGLARPDPVEDQEVEDDPRWRFSLQAEPLEESGLLRLQVTVVENVETRQPRQFTLVRWMPDPERDQAESGGFEMRLPPGFRGARRR